MANDPIVYVIDDDTRVLEGLESLLLSYGYTTKTFQQPNDFLSLKIPDQPACLILDLNLGDTSGLAVQRQLINKATMPIVFLSGDADVISAVKAMHQGASEFLLKPVDEEQILSAVQVALSQARERWEKLRTMRQIEKKYQTLTPREREVLPYIVRGFLNKQTAYELGIMEITIRIHRAQIMKKMSASSLAELVRLASCLGIPDREYDSAEFADSQGRCAAERRSSSNSSTDVA